MSKLPVSPEEVGQLTPDEILKAGDLGYRGMEAVDVAARLKRGENFTPLNREQRREQIRKLQNEKRT